MSKNIWIGIVVIVLVVLAIVYLRPSAPENTAPTEPTPPPAAVNPPPPVMMNPVTMILATENKSGESGTATISEENGKTKVIIALTGASKAGTQPAHFHSGSCAKPGPIKYPLNSVVNGASETTLNIVLADFEKELPLILNVHKSATYLNTYVACGVATPPLPQ